MANEIVELEVRFLETPYQELRIRDHKIERALLVSLEETGQQFPITVIPGEQPGTYVVIDGHRRVRALKKLGKDLVRAQVLNLSVREALLWVRVGQAKAPLNALEEGLLVQELMESHGMSLEEIAVRIDRPKSWVSRRLDLIQVLPESVQRLVREGQVSAASATKILVPVARANGETSPGGGEP